MKSSMKAVEVTGTVDEQGQLHLDEGLAEVSPGRVRIILLLPEDGGIDEQDWLRAATGNTAFDFLTDPVEDIYTPADGKPFTDQG